MSNNVTWDWMRKNLPPDQWTRQTYIDLNFLGSPPEELGPEFEAEIPDELIYDRVVDISTRKPLE